MKILIVILVIIYTSEALLSPSRLAEEWNSFKQSHRRMFLNYNEEQFRKTIFSLKLQLIEDHNDRYRKGLETYVMGVNQFTDYTDEEIEPYIHGLPLKMFEQSEHVINVTSNNSFGLRSADVPSSFDWRDKGVVTPVKNQGRCNSCALFSVNGALEARLAINNLSVTLSEQQLLDCMSSGKDVCKAGVWMGLVYDYILKNGGVNLDTDYPYEGVYSSCRYQPSKPKALIKNYTVLRDADEEKLKEIVAIEGPVAVAIDVTGNFWAYERGVYYNPSCSTTNLEHAAVIVGYGNENGQDYWLVKNSWGLGWGDNGYIKMARNLGNNCGIASAVTYPSV